MQYHNKVIMLKSEHGRVVAEVTFDHTSISNNMLIRELFRENGSTPWHDTYPITPSKVYKIVDSCAKSCKTFDDFTIKFPEFVI